MKHNENIENRLAALDTVMRMDAPPFLYTRILERIRSMEPEKVAPKWVWATAMCLVCILLMNAAIITGSSQPKQNDLEGLARGMQLNNSNDLYR